MKTFRREVKSFLTDVTAFLSEFSVFIYNFLHNQFVHFEKGKGKLVTRLYKQRGRYAGRFVHSGMAGITALGVMVAPMLVRELDKKGMSAWEVQSAPLVLSASIEDENMATDLTGQQHRGSIIEYTVQEGDTVSTIAQKFGVSEETVLWQNSLTSRSTIKIGQTLEILPVTGVAHKVLKGETIYSIAKKYDAEPQAILNFPFNVFANDETFELAVGQTVIVPDGVKKDDTPSSTPRVRQVTPDAGTVVAKGSFVWPTQGTITQRFAWYHPAIDVANRAAPNIVAADSGKVIFSGWDPSGYGNKVMIDHGNGYKTLYAHMQKLFVVVGQTVSRGAGVGQMGSTGRSTGTHLHFEIYKGGARINPLSVLK